MELNLDETFALLSRTPAALNALLRDLPAAWTEHNEGGDTWTATQVVGHLVHCEQVDWLGRAKRILELGESQPFNPVNRNAFLEEEKIKPLADLLDEFARLRSANLVELHAMHIDSDKLAQRGIHRVFGPVTLSQLLATWTTHDMTHLHQISRILAYQYRDAVGPWSVYLGVLRCAGHSEI